ncbi:MAG: hypothetical protein K1X67_02010 [Fimbriimonadaceae bacterium]|nr:hypothetical protein [Fimbriimonadaceae bacterium]
MRNIGRCLLAMLALALLGLLTSCGGSGSGNNSERAVFRVSAVFAPYSGRDIQSYVGSLRITAQAGTDTPLGPFILARGDAPLEISGLRTGKTYVLQIEGLQGVSGTGTKVASAVLERTATTGISSVTIDMLNSEIASLSISPSEVTLKAGESQRFTFEAKNTSGSTILTDLQDTSFSGVLSPTVGSFAPSTTTYTAPAVVNQSTDVRLDATLADQTGSAIIHLVNEAAPLNVALRWNADGRGLPGYARSATLQVLDQLGTPVAGGTRTLVRSSVSAYQESVGFEVPSGSYLLRAEAFPSTDGTGALLASATILITVDAGGSNYTLDMDADSFLGTAIRVIARDPSSGWGLANLGLEMIQGQVLNLEPNLIDQMGNVLLGPSDIRSSLQSGNSVSVTGQQIRASSLGQSLVRFNLGDAPGTTTIQVTVKPRAVSGEINWNALDSTAQSARVIIEWPGGSQNILVRKSTGPGRFAFNQPLIFGVTKRIKVQTFPTSNGTGPFTREEAVGDYLGAIPPALRIPSGF